MEDGDTARELPDPTNPVPQPELYHCQFAPVPREPPTTFNVVELPSQIGLEVAEMLVAAVEFVLTLTVTLTQEVVLHDPSART